MTSRSTLGSTFKLRKTLVVKKIVNFTTEEMWTYGTSGELVKLPPKSPATASPEADTYYVVNDDTKKLLLKKSPAFNNQILESRFTGKGKNDKKIYKFTSSPLDTEVIPISEEYGRCGFVYKKWVVCW